MLIITICSDAVRHKSLLNYKLQFFDIRQVRFPYLDEALIDYLCKVPINIKANPNLPKGEGDKWLLRQLAKQLGLEKTSLEEKRAVQFGARTAKMDNKKQKGSDAL